MRKSLWIVLALLVVGVAQVARADTTESFNFSGTLTNSFLGSDSVTGTFTLDFTKGTITAFDFTTPVITVDASNGFSATLTTFTPAFNPNTDFVELFFQDIAGDKFKLFFQTNLTSFSGNTFFTSQFQPTSTTSDSSGIFHPEFVSLFTSGSATPVTSPEPASLLLLGTGLLGLVGIKRRRSSC